MKTKPIQRVMSVVALMALALTTLVVPAFAAEPSANATLDVAEDSLVPAGEAHTYTLTVRNTGASASGVGALLGGTTDPSINAVVVTVPDYFATFNTTNVVPEGWESELLSNNRLIMRRGLDDEGNETGSAIAPGGSFPFKMLTEVLPQEYDDSARFSVAVSSDRGRNLEAASVAPGGTLDSAVKLLEITNLVISGPPGAEDLTVTDGQDNVTVDLTVQSYASIPLTVDPSISSNGGPTVDTALTGGNAQIPAGGAETYTFSAAFDGTGDVTLNGLATGYADSAQSDERANAAGDQDLGLDVTVQQATDFLFRSSDVDVVSTGPANVSLVFDKSGVPSGTVNAAVALIAPDGSTKNASVSSNPLEYGENSTTEAVTFSTTFSATDLEGVYGARVTFTGTDANDADVSVTVDIADLLRFDATLPEVTVNLALPDGSEVEGEVPAAGNGRRLQISGDVKDGGAKCGACPLSYIVKAGTNQIAEGNLTNNSGDFSTTITLNGMAEGVQAGILTVNVSARDAAGNGPSVGTALTTYDTKKATIEETFPVTGGLGEYAGGSVVNDRIDVIFAEGVDVPLRSIPAQWSVTGKRVDDVTIQSVQLQEDFQVQRVQRNADTGARETVTQKSYRAGQTVWFARLDLNSDLGGNEVPTVTYDPDTNAPGSGAVTGSQSRIFDRVDLTTVRGVRQAFDNIAPALPSLVAVDGKPQYFDDNGELTFWSMGGTATLTIGNVAKGTTVQVFKDGTKIAEQDNTSDNTTQILVEAPLGSVEGPVTIELKALDTGVKASELNAAGIEIDTTAPEAAGAIRDTSDTVTITASDILLTGADADLDFVVIARDNRGRNITLNVVDVSKPAGAEGDPSTLSFENFKKLNQRVLTVDSTSHNLDNLTFIRAAYEGQFGPEAAYKDRAGNTLSSPSDFTF